MLLGVSVYVFHDINLIKISTLSLSFSKSLDGLQCTDHSYLGGETRRNQVLELTIRLEGPGVVYLGMT